MCLGDDQTCPQSKLHRQKLLEDLDHERRGFLKSALVAGGGTAAWAASGTLATPASAQIRPGQPTYHYLPANSDTVTAIRRFCIEDNGDVPHLRERMAQ
jgi:hypothetical protein